MAPVAWLWGDRNVDCIEQGSAMGGSPDYSIPSLSERPAARDGIGYRRKLISVAIGRQAAKNEEAPVGDDDISPLERAIVHGDFGSEPLSLGKVREISLDPAGFRRNGDAGNDGRRQGDSQQEFGSAH